MSDVPSKVFKCQIREVQFGAGVTVVEPVNLYECSIGEDCFIGPFVEIQKGVKVGSRTRVQSHTFICELVTIGDDCYIGHGVMFINGRDLMADTAAPIRQITKDEVYDAVAPTDFGAMLEIDRHLNRSTAFDKIISATHDHFWDPLDKKYIDFNDGFDPDTNDFIPDFMVPALQTDYVSNFFADKPVERLRFKSQMARCQMSAILHGAQGALNLSASLCHVLRDPGAQEYAANQCREEGRHVTAFAKYIIARWGTPLPCGEVLATLLKEIVHAPEVYKKIIGMQMLVEGLAMGAFASIFKEWNDPLAKKLTQLPP